jgi:L-alanine-DL-glutamate epimerase-like enolase superfamily enzyme
MKSLVTNINVDTVVLELPEPLQLGAMRVTRREYAAVEVVTSDGFRGKAYCLTREAPMADIVTRMIAPHLIGAGLSNLPELWNTIYRATGIVGRVGLVRRAIGLVDIALHDAASQVRGQPLGLTLGTPSPELPPGASEGTRYIHPERAMLVASYPTPQRSPRSIADEVLAHARDGWSLLKIARSPDPSLMRHTLAILRSELPAECHVVIDVGFAWRNSKEASDEISQWGDLSLAWLEDPLLPEDIDGIADLRRRTGLAIGVGDEVTDPALLRRLAESDAIDVVRLDVVALGGITPSLEVISWARSVGIPISGHIYPEVTVHLGIGVETFPRCAGPYDPAPAFIIGGPRFRAGAVSPPEAPGLGFELDPNVFDLGKESR